VTTDPGKISLNHGGVVAVAETVAGLMRHLCHLTGPALAGVQPATPGDLRAVVVEVAGAALLLPDLLRQLSLRMFEVRDDQRLAAEDGDPAVAVMQVVAQLRYAAGDLGEPLKRLDVAREAAARLRVAAGGA
jgi:hypothetical protein